MQIYYNIIVFIIFVINKVYLTSDVEFLKKLQNLHIIHNINNKLDKTFEITKDYNFFIIMLISNNKCSDLMFDVYENDNKTLLVSNITIKYSKFANRGYFEKYNVNNEDIQNTNPVMLYANKVMNKNLFYNIQNFNLRFKNNNCQKFANLHVKNLITNKINKKYETNIIYSKCKINQVKAYYRQFKPKVVEDICNILELFMPSVLNFSIFLIFVRMINQLLIIN